ncbi:AB hydrolase superfamily protein YfhM-like isoform X1 [Centruroides vittatus]|uniref:AB hydrolase superfamily protein YfhM-like isoform X1 n=2 Tax=Centruroides vittatus TaxID=120091 RepID=UPI0035103C36
MYSDMADVRQLIQSILLLVLPIFYGWIVLLVTVYRAIKNGKKFFKTEIVDAPKALYDPKLGKHGFIELKNQGIRLHYVEAGDRNKPLVLLLHGFPDFWYSWRHQIPRLAQKYWVVAVDLRGYGESDHPSDVKAYIIKELYEDANELITSFGRDSAIVIGHDWGGVIAWYLTILHPEKVKKLIVINSPHPRAFSSVFRRSLKQFLMSWYMFFFQLPFLPEVYIRANNLSVLSKIYQGKNKNHFTAEELECYKHVFSQPGALTPPLNYYRANLKSLDKNEKDVTGKDKLDTPTLIVWGDRDIALSTDLVKASIKHCNNLKIEMIEGASHWVHHERPETVNNHIENFMKN